MLGKTDPQASFFDSYVEEYFLPKEHELLKIKDEIDFSFIEEETKDLYAKVAGRPSYPPEVMFKILFLEFYYNLSDVEVVKQLKFNVLFRYFVEIKIEDPLPDDTSLVVFRKRLGEERFERIFDKFVKQCKGKGLLKEKLKIVDATHIIADVAIPNTVELLREGRKRILKAIRKEKKKFKVSLEEYSPGQESMQGSTKEDLAKELNLSKDLIEKVKGKYSPRVEELIRLLEKVTHPERKRKLVSFADPDARFGRKSRDKKFAGYKAHIVEDESQIITSCETLLGDENEGAEAHFEALLEKEDKKGLKGEAVVGDALYDSFSNRVNIEKRGMKHHIPEKRNNKKVNEFIYNRRDDQLICPEGYSSIGKTPYENGYLYYFSSYSCRDCERKKKCRLNKDRARIYLSGSHLLFIKTDPEENRKALEKRKRIEAKFGEAKKHYQMARAKYRGRWRVAIQVFMTFIVMNLKRVVRLLKAKKVVAKLAVSSG